MTSLRLLAALPLLLSTVAASAEAPRVATDILPVHGLVSRVMEGVGEPDLVLPPGASPHGYAMRPSEAAALERADLVVWIGPELTPWLERPMETLASDALSIELLEAEGTHLLAFRDAGGFAEAHDDHEDHHGEGEHDDHEDHDDHEAHNGDETADSHDDHGHGHHLEGNDPHAWLDPENGAAWLHVIAEALAGVDPDNAALYRENAEDGAAEIAALSAEIDAQLSATERRTFAIYHDSAQYFEARFGLAAIGTLSLGDGAAPGPATMEELRHRIADEGIDCLFAEPDINPGVIAAVVEGTGARNVVMDPLGRDIATGPDFYPALLEQTGAAFASCL